MASGRPDFRWAAKMRASAAFFLAGAVAGTGLYFSNLAYVRAADARAAAAAQQAAAERQTSNEPRPVGSPLPADTAPGGSVNAVAFSPDDKLLATADSNGTVQLGAPPPAERSLAFSQTPDPAAA